MQRWMTSLPALNAKQDRKAIIEAFRAERPRLLRLLRAKAGASVLDLRLHGSVLEPRRFHLGSDVDVAVIVREGKAARANFVLYVLGLPLVIRVREISLWLDRITMTEAEWPAWKDGR